MANEKARKPRAKRTPQERIAEICIALDGVSFEFFKEGHHDTADKIATARRLLREAVASGAQGDIDK